VSVLIVGGEEIVRATIDRLVTQGDEVRVVENDPRTGEEWRSLGVHVARGPILDADLIERSAQNCRTLVLVDGGIGTESVSEIFDGAALAGVERVVVCTRQRDGIGEALRALPGQYVLLLAGGRRGLLGKRDWVASPEDLARAIDAADDLGGEVRLEVDLSEQEAWRVLGLDPP
jgi:Trk K+ transport system NAD-binding subunit